MSYWMGLRNVYRVVWQCARELGKQKQGVAVDGFSAPRLVLSRCFTSTQKSSNVTVPKVSELQEATVFAKHALHVLFTHSSAVLVPPQQVDGTTSVLKTEQEYPCLSTPVELPKSEGFQEPVLRTEQSDEAFLGTRIEVPKVEKNEPASSTSSNFGERETLASSIQERHKTSVDKKETAKFAAIAASWWDPKGPYKPLHIMNPTRVCYIRSSICKYFGKEADSARPLEGLKIVDVGCGGGLVCEPLARMGGELTGVDAVEKNIGVASVHAARDPATASIKYICSTAEQLVQEQQKFDVVLALEVIEHVADPQDFLRSLAALAKKDGLIFISTLNRSVPSFGLAIVAAEYILGWLPQGTHEWSKFVTPQELCALMDRASISVKDTTGMVYNPLTEKWSISSNTSVNYIAFGVSRTALN